IARNDTAMTNKIAVAGRSPRCGSPGSVSRHVGPDSRHNGVVAAMSTLAPKPIHRYGPMSAPRCAAGALGATSRAIVAVLRELRRGGGGRIMSYPGVAAATPLDREGLAPPPMPARCRRMKVWTAQDLCPGAGLATDQAP